MADAELKKSKHRLYKAAPDLLKAAKIVYAHLVARIDSAPSNAKPVFTGLAELHDAIGKAEPHAINKLLRP